MEENETQHNVVAALAITAVGALAIRKAWKMVKELERTRLMAELNDNGNLTELKKKRGLLTDAIDVDSRQS